MNEQMTIGILGAGKIGLAFAKALFRAGITAKIANSRGPASLAMSLRDLQPLIVAVEREEAAAADLVLVAVPWSRLPAALTGLPSWQGRILIDANNPVEASVIHPVHPLLSSEIVARLAPQSRVVKAFNHHQPHIIAAEPNAGGGRRVQFYSGDDAAANAAVGVLIDNLGFSGIDLGPLREGGRLMQYPGGPLAGHDLVKVEPARTMELRRAVL